MKKSLCILAVLLLSCGALMAGASCPMDGKNSYFTGNIKFVDGKKWKEYRCPEGHTFWVIPPPR